MLPRGVGLLLDNKKILELEHNQEQKQMLMIILNTNYPFGNNY